MPHLLRVAATALFACTCTGIMTQDAYADAEKAPKHARPHAIAARDYGVTAGTSTDQSAALNKAIDAAAGRADIGTVALAEGVYHFAKPVWLKKGVGLTGAGPGKTVLVSDGGNDYLLKAKSADFGSALVSNLTLQNPERIVLIEGVKGLAFRHVEFEGGLVRFKHCAHVTLEHNVFVHTSGKSAYSSSECDKMRLVGNTFRTSVDGSVNLSGHRDSYMAWNHIYADALLKTGYAGIRLPNRAMNNVVEHNLIENHGRGIFVLSGSEGNTIRNNIIRSTSTQGVLVQSSKNVVEGTIVIDAGEQAIYLVNATAGSSPTPSLASDNVVSNNVIYDTREHASEKAIGLVVYSRGNTIKGNRVLQTHGRKLKEIKSEAENQDVENAFAATLPVFDSAEWLKAMKTATGRNADDGNGNGKK